MERKAEEFSREVFVNVNFGLIECLEKAKAKKDVAAPLHVSTPVNLGEVNEGASGQNAVPTPTHEEAAIV